MSMTKLLIALVMLVGTHAMAGTPSKTHQPISRRTDANNIQPTKDDFVPWPWGSEAPFPWSFVQGVWLAEQGEYKSFFSFRVIKSKQGLRQLEVKQIDPVTCKTVTKGNGLEDTHNVVRAVMNNSDGYSYRLLLRSFDEEDLPKLPTTKPFRGQYIVLSILPFETFEYYHISLVQVSAKLDFKCKVQQ